MVDIDLDSEYRVEGLAECESVSRDLNGHKVILNEVNVLPNVSPDDEDLLKVEVSVRRSTNTEHFAGHESSDSLHHHHHHHHHSTELTATVTETTCNEVFDCDNPISDITETISVVSPHFGKLDIKLSGLDIHTRQNVMNSLQIQLQPKEAGETCKDMIQAEKEQEDEGRKESCKPDTSVGISQLVEAGTSMQESAFTFEEVVIPVATEMAESAASVEEAAIPINISMDERTLPFDIMIADSSGIVANESMKTDILSATTANESSSSTSVTVDTNSEHSPSIKFYELPENIEENILLENEPLHLDFDISSSTTMNSYSSETGTYNVETTTTYHITRTDLEITTSSQEFEEETSCADSGAMKIHDVTSNENIGLTIEENEKIIEAGTGASAVHMESAPVQTNATEKVENNEDTEDHTKSTVHMSVNVESESSHYHVADNDFESVDLVDQSTSDSNQFIKGKLVREIEFEGTTQTTGNVELGSCVHVEIHGSTSVGADITVVKPVDALLSALVRGVDEIEAGMSRQESAFTFEEVVNPVATEMAESAASVEEAVIPMNTSMDEKSLPFDIMTADSSGIVANESVKTDSLSATTSNKSSSTSVTVDTNSEHSPSIKFYELPENIEENILLENESLHLDFDISSSTTMNSYSSETGTYNVDTTTTYHTITRTDVEITTSFQELEEETSCADSGEMKIHDVTSSEKFGLAIEKEEKTTEAGTGTSAVHMESALVQTNATEIMENNEDTEDHTKSTVHMSMNVESEPSHYHVADNDFKSANLVDQSTSDSNQSIKGKSATEIEFEGTTQTTRNVELGSCAHVEIHGSTSVGAKPADALLSSLGRGVDEIEASSGDEDGISITVHSHGMEARASSVSSVSVQHIHMSGNSGTHEFEGCEEEGTGLHIETMLTGEVFISTSHHEHSSSGDAAMCHIDVRLSPLPSPSFHLSNIEADKFDENKVIDTNKEVDISTGSSIKGNTTVTKMKESTGFAVPNPNHQSKSIQESHTTYGTSTAEILTANTTMNVETNNASDEMLILALENDHDNLSSTKDAVIVENREDYGVQVFTDLRSVSETSGSHKKNTIPTSPVTTHSVSYSSVSSVEEVEVVDVMEFVEEVQTFEHMVEVEADQMASGTRSITTEAAVAEVAVIEIPKVERAVSELEAFAAAAAEVAVVEMAAVETKVSDFEVAPLAIEVKGVDTTSVHVETMKVETITVDIGEISTKIEAVDTSAVVMEDGEDITLQSAEVHGKTATKEVVAIAVDDVKSASLEIETEDVIAVDTKSVPVQADAEIIVAAEVDADKSTPLEVDTKLGLAVEVVAAGSSVLQMDSEKAIAVEVELIESHKVVSEEKPAIQSVSAEFETVGLVSLETQAAEEESIESVPLEVDSKLVLAVEAAESASVNIEDKTVMSVEQEVVESASLEVESEKVVALEIETAESAPAQGDMKVIAAVEVEAVESTPLELDTELVLAAEAAESAFEDIEDKLVVSVEQEVVESTSVEVESEKVVALQMETPELAPVQDAEVIAAKQVEAVESMPVEVNKIIDEMKGDATSERYTQESKQLRETQTTLTTHTTIFTQLVSVSVETNTDGTLTSTEDIDQTISPSTISAASSVLLMESEKVAPLGVEAVESTSLEVESEEMDSIQIWSVDSAPKEASALEMAALEKEAIESASDEIQTEKAIAVEIGTVESASVNIESVDMVLVEIPVVELAPLEVAAAELAALAIRTTESSSVRIENENVLVARTETAEPSSLEQGHEEVPVQIAAVEEVEVLVEDAAAEALKSLPVDVDVREIEVVESVAVKTESSETESASSAIESKSTVEEMTQTFTSIEIPVQTESLVVINQDISTSVAVHDAESVDVPEVPDAVFVIARSISTDKKEDISLITFTNAGTIESCVIAADVMTTKSGVNLDVTTVSVLIDGTIATEEVRNIVVEDVSSLTFEPEVECTKAAVAEKVPTFSSEDNVNLGTISLDIEDDLPITQPPGQTVVICSPTLQVEVNSSVSAEPLDIIVPEINDIVIQSSNVTIDPYVSSRSTTEIEIVEEVSVAQTEVEVECEAELELDVVTIISPTSSIQMVVDNDKDEDYVPFEKLSTCQVKEVEKIAQFTVSENRDSSPAAALADVEESIYVNVTPQPKVDADVTLYDVPGTFKKVAVDTKLNTLLKETVETETNQPEIRTSKQHHEIDTHLYVNIEKIATTTVTTETKVIDQSFEENGTSVKQGRNESLTILEEALKELRRSVSSCDDSINKLKSDVTVADGENEVFEADENYAEHATSTGKAIDINVNIIVENTQVTTEISSEVTSIPTAAVTTAASNDLCTISTELQEINIDVSENVVDTPDGITVGGAKVEGSGFAEVSCTVDAPLSGIESETSTNVSALSTQMSTQTFVTKNKASESSVILSDMTEISKIIDISAANALSEATVDKVAFTIETPQPGAAIEALPPVVKESNAAFANNLFADTEILKADVAAMDVMTSSETTTRKTTSVEMNVNSAEATTKETMINSSACVVEGTCSEKTHARGVDKFTSEMIFEQKADSFPTVTLTTVTLTTDENKTDEEVKGNKTASPNISVEIENEPHIQTSTTAITARNKFVEIPSRNDTMKKKKKAPYFFCSCATGVKD